MAHLLTAQGCRASQQPQRLARTGQRRRRRHGRLPRYWGPRPRRVAGSWTGPPMATAVGVKPHGRDPRLSRGRLGGTRDEATGLSRCPEGPETLAAFRQLRDGHVSELRDAGQPHASFGRPAGARGLKLPSSPGPAACQMQLVTVSTTELDQASALMAQKISIRSCCKA